MAGAPQITLSTQGIPKGKFSTCLLTQILAQEGTASVSPEACEQACWPAPELGAGTPPLLCVRGSSTACQVLVSFCFSISLSVSLSLSHSYSHIFSLQILLLLGLALWHSKAATCDAGSPCRFMSQLLHLQSSSLLMHLGKSIRR